MSSPRKLFRRPMRKTDLPILPYDPQTITFAEVSAPEGDPQAIDPHLNLKHLERVMKARDEVEARNAIARVSR